MGAEMATSGSYNYTDQRNQLITDALSKIGAISDDETPSDSDMSLGNRTLNRMVKAWQAQELHLWTKETGILIPQKNQRQYQIYGSGDFSTVDNELQKTTLTAAVIATNTALTVSDSTGFVAGDYIGIVLDTNFIYWDVINTVPNSTTINIVTGMSGAAASGKYVFGFTTKLDQPYKIYSANRYLVNGAIDVPMDPLEYQRYFELPNKEQTGTPISYNYVKSRDYGLINVWLVPENIDYLIKFTYHRRIQDFDTSANTPDFPDEWLEALMLNLAFKLSAHFGKNVGNDYIALEKEATDSLNLVLGSDFEEGAIYLQPDYEGGYG